MSPKAVNGQIVLPNKTWTKSKQQTKWPTTKVEGKL